MSRLLPVFLVFLTLPAAAANRLYIEPATVAPGDTDVALPILLDNDQTLYGFSLSLVTDASLLEMTDIDLAGTQAADAGWSFGMVEDEGAHLVWGVVMDVTDPFDTELVIPVGTGVQIATLLLDVTAAEEGEATVSFQDVPSPDPSTVADAKNILVSTDGGARVDFTSEPGVITIEADVVEPEFIRGNSNGDAAVDISDAVYHLNFLFSGGTPPPCRDASDSDDSGVLDITDAIYLLAFLFQGGPAVPAPYPDPGVDPTADELGCEG